MVDIDQEQVTMATVKIESTKRELKIATSSLKKKTHADLYANPIVPTDRKQGKGTTAINELA